MMKDMAFCKGYSLTGLECHLKNVCERYTQIPKSDESVSFTFPVEFDEDDHLGCDLFRRDETV